MKEQSNPYFCYAPWLSLHVWPDGSVFPCCTWNPDDSIGNINNQGLEEIWNNDRLKDIRLKMLEGKPVKSCSRCYNIEKTSPNSYRIKINRDFKGQDYIVEQTDSNGNVKDMQIKLWDFRLSNFCNLRCRSCGLELSSSWYNDVIQLHPTLKGKLKALISVNDKVSFLDMIENQYDYVEEIYFAGGEPLITPEHYTILDKLIEKGNTNIRLRYSTNFSNLRFKDKHIFDYWKHFPNLEIMVSLDGVKEKGEYIRKGLDYSLLKENLYKLRDSNLTTQQIGFMITYGVLNYEHLFDMVLEFIQSDLADSKKDPDKTFREIHFSPIYNPAYYDCRYLPKSFKERFKRRLDKFDRELHALDVTKDVTQGIIHKLKQVYSNSISGEFDKDIMEEFVKRTTDLDVVRKENFEDIFPEYKLKADFVQNQLM